MKMKWTMWLGLGLIGLQADALTIHRSFRMRDVGFGGGASVSVPVDAKVSKAIDEGRQAVRKDRSIVGRVTWVGDGGTITVTPNGGTGTKVRFRDIVAPKRDQPGGEGAAAFVKGLVYGQKVEVKYAKRDDSGCVLGTVYYKSAKGMVDVNLTMILNGWAKCDNLFEANSRQPAYARAEQTAHSAQKGIWAESQYREADENPPRGR